MGNESTIIPSAFPNLKIALSDFPFLTKQQWCGTIVVEPSVREYRIARSNAKRNNFDDPLRGVVYAPWLRRTFEKSKSKITFAEFDEDKQWLLSEAYDMGFTV